MNQSKKISRKVISLVLSLLMVFSCFSGMGLTAFASEPYLTFTGTDSFSIKTNNSAENWDGTLEYSTDANTWTTWDGTQISSDNNVLYLRGTGNTKITGSGSSSDRWVINTQGTVACSGDIRTLLDYTEPESSSMGTYCFSYLFYNCTSLTAAPELPATILAHNCYYNMFYGCTSLTTAPELPATTLASQCYSNMFYGCESLTAAPELWATTLTPSCYNGMFNGCTSLTTAPELPATTLAASCYFNMFNGCTSLTTAPELPATTLAALCYFNMFNGCEKLTTPSELPAIDLTNRCYSSMFEGCTGIKLSTEQTAEYSVPYSIPKEGTGSMGSNSLTNMFTDTGGTFTGTPTINTTYYIAAPAAAEPAPTVPVSPANSGTVEVVEDGNYWKFTATPASGYEFDCWKANDDGYFDTVSDDNPCTIVKNSFLTMSDFTAVFKEASQTETLLTTITATGDRQASYSTANVANVSFSTTAGGSSAYLANWGWWGYGWIATVTPADGYTITKCVFYDDANRIATDSSSPFVVETTEEDKTPRINGTPIDGGNYQSKGIKKIEVYGYQTPSSSYADYLPAATDDATALAAKIVKFGGMDWYLIEDNSTSATEGTVTLFAKECVGASAFNSIPSNTYSGSTLESYVNNWSANNISTDAKSAVSGDVFLLTTDQAQAITNTDVLKCSQASGAAGNYWWLCSPGTVDYTLACVDGENGDMTYGGNDVNDVFGVRPALQLDLSKVGFNSETNTFAVPHIHDDITFTAWTSTNSLPTDGGNYYLTNDVKLDNTWYAPNGAINLCLDGHSITAAEGREIQLMDVENGATLNLYDKEDNSGSVSGAVSANGAILVNSGTFNMYGGTIKDNMTTDHGAGVRVKYGGTFSLYGGSIENNKTKNPGGNGGGVHVETNSTFNMSGGSIKNNTAFSSAGVFIGTNCTFNMSGGSITGNIATNGYGGVLFTDDGTATFKLSGDVTISDNITKIDIDEIDVHETHPSNIVMPDSMTIEVVDALTGEGKIYVQIGTSRVFTNSTGSVKAKDYIDKFVSDSATYRIKTEGDELRIEAPHLRVGGTFVYDDNAADVFGDGKVKFTPANDTTTYATLTLNGYQYDGTADDDSDGIIYLDAAQLRIVLKGENVVKATNPGIMINRQLDTIISSENGGSLEVVSELGDAIYANGALTVESGTISATGTNRGIAANGINLSGGKIVAKGTGERGYGIYCDNPPWMPDNSISINSGISSLIASGTLGAVYGNVANELEGLGWSNITGTEGQETIAVAAEARSLEYKKVAFVSHTHNFTYSVNAAGDTITATCDNADGECTLTDYKATLKIAAPEELTYDKSAKAAVITDANGIQGTAKVQYQTKSGSTYSEATETAPTNAGTYKASITLGGATASVEYTIAKADPTCTAPTGLTATYGQTLADVTLTNPSGNTAGTWAWADSRTSVGNAGTNTFKASFVPTDTTNYNTKTNIDVSVTVGKANQTAPEAPTEAGKTINSITLNEIPNGEYKCGTGDWQTSPTFTGLDQNKGYVFRQRYAADANHNASAGSEETIIYTANHEHSFTYSASNGTITATCNGAGTCDLTDNKVSFTLTAPTNLVYDGTDKKATLEGVEAFNAATGLNVSADDIVYNDLTNVVTETKNAGTYQALYTLQTDFPRPFVGITFTVAKANPTYEAPKGIYAAYGDTLADVTLPDGWAWVDDTTSVGDVGKRTFKANYTPADTTNYNVVENVDVTVKVNPADITPTVSLDGWTYNQTAKTPSVSGNSGNGEVTYTYATKGSDNFSETVPTNAGNYTVKATIAATTNYNGATATADFTIAKADPTYTVPTDLYATYGDTLADVTLPERWAWADDTTSVGNVGTKTFKASFTPADTTNYNTVNDVDVTVKVSKADPTYEAPKGIYAAYGDTLADVTLPDGWAWVNDTTSVGDVGKKTFKANFTPADTTNYNVVENVDVTVKVNPADITPTVTLDGWTYGDEANKPSVKGNAGNGDVAYTYAKKGSDNFSATVPTNAGNYTVKATIAATANYNGANAEADFTIAKAKVTITADDKAIMREAALTELTYKVDGKILDGDDLGIKVSSDVKADVAGKYDIKVAYTENANYDVTVVNGTYTVTDRITATEKTAGKNKINSSAKGTAGKKGFTVKWDKVENAEKYEIYAAYCGKNNKYKKIKTVKGNINSFDITKLSGKKVNTSKCLKVYVVAYRKVNGKYEKITKSLTMHIAGKTNKRTNAKAIKVKKSSYTLKVNKTATIKPTLVLEKKNKKAVEHAAKFRYQSTNKAVATVDKNGKIKAVGKGTCTIYIFANNGKLKSVKVTVK